MKTNDLKFDYTYNVHAITRSRLADYLGVRVKAMLSNKGFNSFGTISQIADMVSSYNEISSLDFFIHARQFLRK